MRLLIAEDSPKLLKSLVHIFEVNGYVVDGVDNGTDALAFAQSGEYDGLVLDVMMPGLDGIEVLRRLRETTTCPSPSPPRSCSRACGPCCGGATPTRRTF